MGAALIFSRSVRSSELLLSGVKKVESFFGIYQAIVVAEDRSLFGIFAVAFGKGALRLWIFGHHLYTRTETVRQYLKRGARYDDNAQTNFIDVFAKKIKNLKIGLAFPEKAC